MTNVRNTKSDIVTIDGPVGSGKSTVGKVVADRLGFVYLDTGAMYRAVAVAGFHEGIDLHDESALASLCSRVHISFGKDGDRQRVFLNGKDVTDEIRTPENSMRASAVSAVPAVRQAMVRLQQEIGEDGGVVADGRDAGTVIFPRAGCKFYLDAGPEIRARRRYKELLEKHMKVSYDYVFNDIKDRDKNDTTRMHSPLKPAADAVIIDTSEMSIEDVVDCILNHIRQKRSSLP